MFRSHKGSLKLPERLLFNMYDWSSMFCFVSLNRYRASIFSRYTWRPPSSIFSRYTWRPPCSISAVTHGALRPLFSAVTHDALRALFSAVTHGALYPLFSAVTHGALRALFSAVTHGALQPDGALAVPAGAGRRLLPSSGDRCRRWAPSVMSRLRGLRLRLRLRNTG